VISCVSYVKLSTRVIRFRYVSFSLSKQLETNEPKKDKPDSRIISGIHLLG
jgi:hypothetical protein